ncbi:TPA_asm: hypothetical protein GZK45_15110 [Listeria innocua]|uniref:hypothetical protein n=1 Tax=Listeria monocytogenes TaxID=1639 RepID=UPI0004D7DF00|nr:hypothetical protein [Listeria monocytogenes]HAC3177468.1 hypothetical protein [Listeria innocua]EAD4735585.1 hypothetical protein [Listeria monocytogenes]EAE3927073.1 hypothetical protein [Listeria monocytogenes]EAF2383526.1 hypothetical protein [Listeria monocytogenes]EAF2410777.1 hypothetical protein [Listeria monocytogenes]
MIVARKWPLALFLVIVTMFVFFQPKPVAAETAEAWGPYSWTDPGGITHTTALIKIGSLVVYCIDPSLNAPFGGSDYSNGKGYTEGTRAILYYGYGGEGNEIGNSNTAMVKTWVAIINWQEGKHDKSTYSNKDSDVWSLIQHAKKEDTPNYDISFSKTNINSSVVDGVQKSQSIKISGNGEITIKVPEKVTMYLNGTKKTSKTVKISGGDTFYFTAPLSYDADFNTGNLNGSVRKYSSILYLPYESGNQRLVGGKYFDDPVKSAGFKVHFEARQSKMTVEHRDKYDNTLLESSSSEKTIGTNYSYKPKTKITKGSNTYIPTSTTVKTGTVGSKDKTIIFYYNLQREITVEHRDLRDDRLITTDKYTKLRGQSYSYLPKKDLKKGSYMYRPTSTTKKTGTVGAKNITLTFYYDVPLVKIALEKLQVYTALATKGLPVKLDLAKTLVYKNNTTGMTTSNLTIGLYQGKTKLDSLTYTAQKLPKKASFTIKKGLAVNQHLPYTIKLEGFNKNDFDVVSTAKQLTTQGYTSSEEVIEPNAAKKNQVDVKRVIMTSITPTTKMKSYYEHFVLEKAKIPTMKTGYGFENNVSLTYSNELAQTKTFKAFTFATPKKLIDSFVEAKAKGNNSTITMVEESNKSMTTNGVTTTSVQYQLPHIQVEKQTGYLFSDEQVKAKDKRIQFAMRDGGHKFYLPIWMDLGKYDTTTATGKLGTHAIQVNWKDQVNVEAFMYVAMDSKTKAKDEILLKPINADDPFPEGLPKGWSKADVKWLGK